MTKQSLKYFFSEIGSIPVILQSSHYPSLNGLRGIAIIMVVLSHLGLSENPLYKAVANGHLGVLIFFVISGFLIITLCIKEKVVTKGVSLKKFYIRRILRIFPVAYLYLVAIITINLIYKLDIHYINLLGAGLYLMDFSSYFRKHYFSWYTGHYWSLAVEEQFYLIVPFILKNQFVVYLSLILFIIFALPVIISLQYFYPPLNTGLIYAFTHFMIKFQAIAVGCLFSVIIFKYPGIKNTLSQSKLIGNIIAIFLILFIHYDDLFTLDNMYAGMLISFLTGYIIVSNISQSKDLVYKLLNSRILEIIGVLSYSIYIWQQLFTSKDTRLPGFMVVFPYNIICIIAVSCLSYYCYESFFLKLKSKYTKIKTDARILAPL